MPTPAEMHRDLGLDEQPDDEEFDDFIMHVYGGSADQGRADPRRAARARRGAVRGGAGQPGARDPARGAGVRRAGAGGAGVAGGAGSGSRSTPRSSGSTRPPSGGETVETDRVEAIARDLVEQMDKAELDPARAADLHDDPEVQRVLEFAATEVVPRLAGTADELDAVVHALDGGFVAAGPRGSPLRGLVNVLPTGRNFYTVDPRAVPSRLAWQTGQAMADVARRERYVDETGAYPQSVGLSVWGTSAMRTSGDDVAEVLALLGVRPVWDDASRRVSDLQVVPLAELGRPRIDVTVRISGFFRDAFPHVVAMLDDAVRLVAALEEPDEHNHVRAHARADLAEHGDERRSTTRIFGSKPGSYGAGILQVVESGNWRNDDDLAEVYTAWGGFAYGRDLDGAPAADDMRTNYRRIKVAAKNVDTREHDIADSDDYFQYHGGMVATVRALTGSDPKAYVGDSTTPRRGPHPHAAGGDEPRLPLARGQPAVDRGDAAPRLQGRLRARRDRRLPLRLRRHRRRGARLDVRVAGQGVRPRRDQPGVPADLQPVGAARDRRAAARGRRARPVGGAGRRRGGRHAAGLPRRRGRQSRTEVRRPSGSSASAWAPARDARGRDASRSATT